MDKKQAIFNENDIPYKELELIGISKKQIWSLDKANITALLSGKRTSLLDLSFHDNNGEEGICIYNHRTTKTNQKYPSVNL
ncbi:DUF4099 domain-containing protein [Phocaeicola vulgatus]|uniref:DUF4099 domain-containing protein n=1 Tax=Phocaeicola vulgatus TaxID=821 RepID=UPI002166A089|nr:DUF4099 domain-containing protein [Phocaeicola vulgatus]